MSTTEDHAGESQVYEIGYLILPSIPEDKLPEVVDSIKKIVAQEGAKELDGESPFLRKLAYPMSKTVGASRYIVENAYLGWLKFEAESSQVEAIKAGVEGLQEVLRMLLIKAPRESEFTFAKAREAAEDSLAEEEIAVESDEEVAEPESDDIEPVNDKPDEEVVE